MRCRGTTRWLGSVVVLAACSLAAAQPARPAVTFKAKSPVKAAAFLPGGQLLAVGTEDGRLTLHEAATGRETAALGPATGPVDALLALPGTTSLFSSGKDRLLHAWDTAGCKEMGTLPGHTLPVTALAFAGHGRVLLSASYDRSVRVWDPVQRRHLRTLALDAGAEPLLAAAAEGTVVAVIGSLEQTDIRLWDVDTGRDLRRLRYHPVGITAVAVTPDGSLVASAGRDGLIRLWEASSGRVQHVIRGEQAAQFRLAFSPDGRTLAAAAQGEVTLWETASARPRLRLQDTPPGRPYALAFDARGRRLVAGTREGAVAVWSLADKPAPLAPADLAARWADLAGEDGPKAYGALLRLAAAPTEAVPFLAERLRAAPGLDAERISRLVRQLDDDDFTARENATRELERIGKGAEEALRQALKNDPSAELRRRAEVLLDKALAAGTPALALRDLRAVEVLEACATPEARKVLERLGAGSAAEQLTAEARASLRRLAGPR